MLLTIWLLAWLATTACLQVYRYYRFSNATQKQQTKWVVFGFGSAIFLSLLVVAPYLSLSELRQPGPANAIYQFFAFTVILVGFLFFAVSIGIALLRYRLFDVDLLIRRTLVYTLVTGLLALLYVASVVSFQTILRVMSGQESELVVVASTLGIAALFNPLRRRMQAFVDRRYNRGGYDAQEVLATFSQAAREHVNVEQLTQALLMALGSTVQPDGMALWLREQEMDD